MVFFLFRGVAFGSGMTLETQFPVQGEPTKFGNQKNSPDGGTAGRHSQPGWLGMRVIPEAVAQIAYLRWPKPHLPRERIP